MQHTPEEITGVRVEAVTDPERFAKCLEVRFEVFVHEQNVAPDAERDHLDDDPRTLHCLATAPDGTPVGAGRLLAPHTDSVHGSGSGHGDMDPATPHIGRLAVSRDARGLGVGAAMMNFLEAAALERHGAHGTVRVELSAQDQAMEFYRRLGYTPYGDGYLDEGIWHHDAYKDLSASDAAPSR